MLPTEAKNQQCATSKTDPATLSKSYPLDLVLEAQRKGKGRRAFAASLLTAGLGDKYMTEPFIVRGTPLDEGTQVGYYGSPDQVWQQQMSAADAPELAHRWAAYLQGLSNNNLQTLFQSQLRKKTLSHLRDLRVPIDVQVDCHVQDKNEDQE